MYQIKHNSLLKIIEVTDSKNKVYGKIHLKDGASLQELTLNGHEVIQSLEPLAYNNTYASSILFPFANRIKDGTYSFKEKTYQFDINQKEENNALHGLVYNKTFQLIESNTYKDSATITLEYIEEKKSIGFPYSYKILLKYTFSETNLKLSFSVKNTDSKTFPFTLGWHPYFTSDNLQDSILKFDASEKLIIGDRNITTGIKKLKDFNSLQIENKKLDDCWALDSNKIEFITPKYKLSIKSSKNNNFIQAYTPPRLNTIAIEPTTGVSDSFNNKIGLETLSPNQVYTIIWNTKIDTT